MRQFLVFAALLAVTLSWPVKRSEGDFDHWFGAYNVGEDDVNNASPEEAEAYRKKLMNDANRMDMAISALFDGDLSKAEDVFYGLGFMMALAKHDAENGENDIAAHDIGERYNCVEKAESIDECDNKFGSILQCVQAGVRDLKKVLSDSSLTNVKKVSIVKGICNGLGKEAENIFQAAEECYGEKEEKEENHWEGAWRATQEEIERVPDDELKRYKELMRKDLWGLIHAINRVLTEAGTKEDEYMIGEAIAAESSVVAAPLPEGYNDGCTRADFDAAVSCDAKFGKILGCIAGAAGDLLDKLETQSEACYGPPPEERSLKLSKKPWLGQAKKSLTSTNKEELKRLLKEYLNSRK
uniref:Uncharacterized protein n=1 Tax=Magallana gigas TaxID=29159 RepID=K1PV81_MAGGI